MRRYSKMSKLAVIIGSLCITTTSVHAQKKMVTLDHTIQVACQGSLRALSARNTFLASYWEYRSYQAARLPSLSMRMLPLQYERSFTNRYDSELNQDVYRKQQSLYSYGNLALEQNFDLTGGTFYLDSELGYRKNFGTNDYQQFSTVPIRLGYNHTFLGYNSFKWEKKIEPLKYEKAKKKLLYTMEEISESAAQYFFTLAMAQVEFDLAKSSLASSDTLYRIGIERQEIASISQADLLTLKLDLVNAGNSLQNAEINLKKAQFSYFSFLNMDKQADIQLVLPERPELLTIPAEMALIQLKQNNPDFLSNHQSLLEAEQKVDKTSRSSKMDASLNMSFGFNQAAFNLKESYQKSQQQDLVSFRLNIPLVDWGVRKGKVNMARNELNVTQLAVQQDEISLEEDIVMTVSDFAMQQKLINSAEEAKLLSDMAYNATKERYLIGKADMSGLTLALNRKESARKNYVSALNNYWMSYFKIRKLTLYDFASNEPLTKDFEKKYGIH